MAPKSNETASSGTLPAPELNPLLNPILNKNLGRWAEVYFTNPPERRDEAVLNLLRQLEREPDKEPITPAKTQQRSFPTRREPRDDGAIFSSTRAVVCPGCGFENDIHQRFCGECGAPLGAPATSATAIVSPPAGTSPAKAPELRDRLAVNESDEVVPQFGSILHLSDAAPRTGPLPPQSGFRRDLSGSLAPEEPESSGLKGSSRALIGAALAVMIGALGYVAWRSAQSSRSGSALPAEAPPVVTQPASQPALRSSPQKTGSPLTPENATSVSQADRPATTSDARLQKDSKAATEAKPEVSPNDSPAVSGNGNQELTTALGFLNGVGQHRDSAQAAPWLWKAVEKRNTQATVLLGGLYLRGDGVQKNCDQGRILLDAAADKGNKDAASLLRNMQAFGCE